MALTGLTTSNITAFTTTAGTEAVVAVAVLPFNNGLGEGVTVIANVNFSAVNAATTALAVKIRQASFSGGNIVVTTPTGTLLGTGATSTFTAGTLSTAAITDVEIDQAPTLIASTNLVPAQAASNNAPGQVLQGAGVCYVLTVTSTTNVATVAAGAAKLVVLVQDGASQ